MSILTKVQRLSSNSHFPIRQIAIMRALPGLGDLLCAVPAWRALRTALPQAHITLIGLPHTQSMAARFGHYIDSFLPFPGFPGLREKTACIPDLLAFLSTVQGRFDLALQMHGSGLISNIFTALLGARHTAGFYPPSQECPDKSSFLPYPRRLSEVQRYLTLLSFLGMPCQGNELEFPFQEKDYDDLAALGEAGILPASPYVCIHPGASQPAKRWSPKGFACVGDALTEWGFQVVLTGSISEKPVTTAVAAAMEHSAINLAGRTSLGAMALLLQEAYLLICNDTGISHLAAALQVPSVITFLQADAVPRWAPLDQRRHRALVLSHKYEQNHSRYSTCAVNQSKLTDVTAVLSEARSLLNQETTYVG